MAKRTTFLAKELQLLHVNANVYNDLFEDEQIEILCEGDTILATKNLEDQKKDLAEEESDEDVDADDLKASLFTSVSRLSEPILRRTSRRPTKLARRNTESEKALVGKTMSATSCSASVTTSWPRIQCPYR